MRKSRFKLIGLLLLLCSIVPVWSALAEEPIRLAAIYAVTGVAAEQNAPSLQGVKNAVAELNRQGGLLGRPVELLVLDNLSTPIGSLDAAERARDRGVAAIIGAAWSSHSLAIAQVAQAAGIPMVSSYSTSPALTRIGDYIFRVCYTDDFQGAVLAQFAIEDLNARTAVIFTDVTSEYSISLSQIFRANFEQQGGKILDEIEYKLKQPDFTAEVQRTKRSGADVVLLAGHFESGRIARDLQQGGVKAIPLGGDGWVDGPFLDNGGSELRQGFFTTHWAEQVESQRSRDFVRTYKPLGSFGTGTALAYDATMVVADAIRRAGSIEHKAVRNALRTTKGFPGITGSITFDAQGNPLKSVVIMKIHGGKIDYLKTLTPDRN